MLIFDASRTTQFYKDEQDNSGFIVTSFITRTFIAVKIV